MFKTVRRSIRRLLGGGAPPEASQPSPTETSQPSTTETSQPSNTETPEPIRQGFTPMSQTLAEDVFIVGYPKSGNTWFQNLVAGVVYGVIPEFAPPALALYELVPDVHTTTQYKRYATPMFFKSHHLPRPEYRRVVYLLRDGRDAMVSYFHYLKALQEPITFLELVRNGTFPSKWHDHVEAWLANPHGAQMITISYEDLKRDGAGELGRFCQFIGIERERAFLEMIARSASFDKMRQRERQQGWGAENPQWLKDKFFHRRGQVGSYKDEMPADALETFLAEAGPTLKRAGYLV